MSLTAVSLVQAGGDIADASLIDTRFDPQFDALTPPAIPAAALIRPAVELISSVLHHPKQWGAFAGSCSSILAAICLFWGAEDLPRVNADPIREPPRTPAATQEVDSGSDSIAECGTATISATEDLCRIRSEERFRAGLAEVFDHPTLRLPWYGYIALTCMVERKSVSEPLMVGTNEEEALYKHLYRAMDENGDGAVMDSELGNFVRRFRDLEIENVNGAEKTVIPDTLELSPDHNLSPELDAFLRKHWESAGMIARAYSNKTVQNLISYLQP